MKQKLPVSAAFWTLLACLWIACTKPTPFGADFLEGQQAEIAFTDTISFTCTLEREDSIATSDRTGSSPYFLCGTLNDAVFGKTTAEIYTLFQWSVPDPGFNVDSFYVDSIVLYLNYEPAGFYGDTLTPQTLRVYQLSRELVNDSVYYSNQSLPTSWQVGAVQNFLPKPNARDSLINATARGAFLRVPLSKDFARSLLLLDSATYSNDSAFYHRMRGLKITAESSGSPGAMLAFDINDETFTRIRMYFRYNNDTVQSTYDYFLQSCNKFVHFKHDYSGTPIAAKLGQPINDLLYLQPMAGLRVKVDIPYIANLENIAVNEADLVLVVENQDDPNAMLLDPAEQLVLTRSIGDTTFAFTSDVLYSLGPTLTGGFSAFGGTPESYASNGVSTYRYKLALSQYLQDLVDDNAGEIKKTIYINVQPPSRSAMRALLHGPASTKFPAKIELKYTRL